MHLYMQINECEILSSLCHKPVIPEVIVVCCETMTHLRRFFIFSSKEGGRHFHKSNLFSLKKKLKT